MSNKTLKEWNRLTSRTYEGVKVLMRSESGEGEKHVGFDSAAVAIMQEWAPKRITLRQIRKEFQ